jgi:hypothetical protein
MIVDSDEVRDRIKKFLVTEYDVRPQETDIDTFIDFVNELPTFDEVNTETNSFNL